MPSESYTAGINPQTRSIATGNVRVCVAVLEVIITAELLLGPCGFAPAAPMIWIVSVVVGVAVFDDAHALSETTADSAMTKRFRMGSSTIVPISLSRPETALPPARR